MVDNNTQNLFTHINVYMTQFVIQLLTIHSIWIAFSPGRYGLWSCAGSDAGHLICQEMVMEPLNNWTLIRDYFHIDGQVLV